MTEIYAELDTALDRVVAAARAHLAAVKAADGEPDDDAVWRAYVALNNASHEYDERLNDVFGEVTPWDLEEISAEEAEGRLGTVISEGGVGGAHPVGDAHPAVISVRQRRDYRVPSVTALLRAADVARAGMPQADEEPRAATASVVEAVLELLQSGDGSLSMLDVPELDPLDGLVIVAEVVAPLDPDQIDENDGAAPFLLTTGDRTLGRLDERPFVEIDSDGGIDTTR